MICIEESWELVDNWKLRFRKATQEFLLLWKIGGYIFIIAGRLTLTDHALYFEEHRVVSYDKAKLYDLAEDLQQVVKPELTGPWGTRLFDKAVFYKSLTL